MGGLSPRPLKCCRLREPRQPHCLLEHFSCRLFNQHSKDEKAAKMDWDFHRKECRSSVPALKSHVYVGLGRLVIEMALLLTGRLGRASHRPSFQLEGLRGSKNFLSVPAMSFEQPEPNMGALLSQSHIRWAGCWNQGTSFWEMRKAPGFRLTWSLDELCPIKVVPYERLSQRHRCMCSPPPITTEGISSTFLSNQKNNQ